MRLCTCFGVCLILAGSLLRPGYAVAEEKVFATSSVCTETLSLESFRALALNKSPLISSINYEFSQALARSIEIEVLANPELSVEKTYTNDRLAGDDEAQMQVSIGQPLRLSNFGSRARVAALIREAGDREQQVKLLEFIQNITVQFKTLSALQQSKEIILDAQRKAAEKHIEILSGVKKGLLSAGDEFFFEGEKYRLSAQANGVAASIEMLQKKLSEITGTACLIRTPALDELEPIPDLEVLLEKAQQSDLSVEARSRVLHTLARAEEELAEMDSYPLLIPRIVYQHTNDGGDFFGAGITIPIPFWNRNQSEKIKARSQQVVTEKRISYLTEGGLIHQIALLRQAAENAQQQSILYSSKVIPAFARALAAQEKLYARGKGSVLQVWQALRAHTEAQAQGLQHWIQAVAIRVELSIVIGEEV